MNRWIFIVSILALSACGEGGGLPPGALGKRRRAQMAAIF